MKTNTKFQYNTKYFNTMKDLAIHISCEYAAVRKAYNRVTTDSPYAIQFVVQGKTVKIVRQSLTKS